MDILNSVTGVISALIGVAIVLFALRRRYKMNRPHRTLQRLIPKEYYSRDVLELSTRYYIPPYCTPKPPAQTRETGRKKNVKEDLFEKIDHFLNTAQRDPFLWVLGDLCIGKTSFVLNYFAHNQRRFPWRRKRMFVIPLNLPDVENEIKKIEKQKKSILFLDGFDEDTDAVGDYAQRLEALVKLCQKFERLIITSRPQFFPSDEAIPLRTSVSRIGPRPAGTPRVLTFSKLYLTPLTDNQIKKYLKKLYAYRERKKRSHAFAFLQKIPILTIRPMLLTCVPELLKSEKTFQHTCQIYEEMLDIWLYCEKPNVADKDSLRTFCEHLAVDLYTGRQARGAERIQRDELEPFARKWGIDLNEWQPNRRSLLNHDALGYYKFAHRSIMEYLFVKRLVDKAPQLMKIERTEQMNIFLQEISQWPKKKIQSDRYPPLTLRTKPETLDDRQVGTMLSEFGYYHSLKTITGEGIFHLFEIQKKQGCQMIVDHTTGLTWHQGGSEKYMGFEEAQQYIEQLNRKGCGGYNDWRLPTLEEAMSLMEPEKKHGNLYIDPVFDKAQTFILTADKTPTGHVWYVNFSNGVCNFSSPGSRIFYVRAVRL